MIIHDDKHGKLSNFAGQLFLSSVAWALSHWEWVTTTPFLAILDRSWAPCLTRLPVDGNIAQNVALCIISWNPCTMHAWSCIHIYNITEWKLQVSNIKFILQACGEERQKLDVICTLCGLHFLQVCPANAEKTCNDRNIILQDDTDHRYRTLCICKPYIWSVPL